MMRPGTDTVRQAISHLAHLNKVNPLRDYLMGVHWDGTLRIDTWLSDYAGVENSEYTRLVGRKFLLSAVARGLEPGCKADHMLVLEGAQGIQKSTVAKALAPNPEWFVDRLPDVRNKDAVLQLHGHWIVEVSEMDGVNRAEVSAIKAFLSADHDTYRPPYGSAHVTIPRSCVFVGTINPDGDGRYFRDTTGNRRYWPVSCTLLDAVGLAAVRDQLWAEAVRAYQSGEIWWVDRDTEHRLVKPEQAARQETDSWADLISVWLNNGDHNRVTVAALANACLQIPPDRMHAGVTRRIASALKELGWVKSGRTYYRNDAHAAFGPL